MVSDRHAMRRAQKRVVKCRMATTFSIDINFKTKARTRVVTTKYGKVQGYVTRVGRDALHQKHVEIYLGVPYASPPTGNHRFAPTRPPVHWAGIRTSNAFGPVCPQAFPDISNVSAVLEKMPRSRLQYLQRIRPKLIHESEDCLHLNIYVPKEKASSSKSSNEERGGNLYPVVVFIHGESFSWGSGNLHDGRVLATYAKIIVITVNYRLGIFGFLNTNINPEKKPRMANYGLMDQIAALKWIQENVEAFGGDPKAVTLMGHNTGAAAIHFLMQSPVVVPGLFHRVIMMSGSAFSDWALVDDPVHNAVQLASHFNCSIPRNMLHEHENILKCLRLKSSLELGSFRFKDNPTFLTPMGPSRDGILIPSDFNINVDRMDGKTRKSRSNSRRSYQVLIGSAQDETSHYFSNLQIREGISKEMKDRYLRTLVKNTYTFHLKEIFATIENEYTDWSKAKATSSNLQNEASRAITDKLYTAPVHKTTNWANENGCTVFLYVNGHPMVTEGQKSFKKSAHGQLVPLVFGYPFAPELDVPYLSFTSQQASLAQTLIMLWSNFARSGNPNKPNDVDSLFGLSDYGYNSRSATKPNSKAFRPTPDWIPYNSESQQCFQIGSMPRMAHHFRTHELSIWLNLIPKLHSAGADNIFPQHNSFDGNDDPQLFTGVVRPAGPFPHGYQVNRDFYGTTGSPPVTTCIPLQEAAGAAASIGSSSGISRDSASESSLVKLENANIAYQQIMYLTVGMGAILLAVNVWFLICFIFCRSRIGKCFGVDNSATNGLQNKEISCETELLGFSSSRGSVPSLRDYSTVPVPVNSSQGSRRRADATSCGVHSSGNADTLRLIQGGGGNGSGGESDNRSISSLSGIQSAGSRSQRGSEKYRSSHGRAEGISFISSSNKASYPQAQNYSHQEQMAMVMALANTELNCGDRGQRIQPTRESSTLPRKPMSDFRSFNDSSPSSSSTSTVKPIRLNHSHSSNYQQENSSGLQGSLCRLHEVAASSNGDSSIAANISFPSVISSSATDSPDSSVSNASMVGRSSDSSVIIRNTQALTGGQSQSTGTIKRNQTTGNKQKFTTFCAPEAQITEGSTSRRSATLSPTSPTVSFADKPTYSS